MNVIIAVVATSTCSTHFTVSLADLLLQENRVRNVLINVGGVNLDYRRNMLVAEFLKTPAADVLLFIDSDMTFAPDAVGRMLEHLDPEDCPVLGGLAFSVSQKGPKVACYPTIYRRTDLWGDIYKKKRRLRHTHSFEEDTLMRVDGTGAACLMIHRSVFEKVPGPWFQYTQIEGDSYGEDLFFCDLLNEHGIPVYVHTGIEFGHHKSVIVTKEDFYESQS